MKKIFTTIYIFTLSFTLCLAQSNYNVDKFEYISPVPGSGLLRPETNIIIRYGDPLKNFDKNDTTLVIVNGSLSGYHSGTLYLTKDSKTIVFLPDKPFNYAERVSVQLSTGLITTNDIAVDSLSFYFDITKGIPATGTIINQGLNKTNNENEISSVNDMQITSDSSLLFPPNFPEVYIQQSQEGKDYYFLGINNLYSSYLCILNKFGYPIFYKIPGQKVYDFKLQASGILTYYDGSKDMFYGMDSLYQVVDSFYCKNGYATDYHDLQVLPDGHYFMISADKEPVNMDTVVTGGDTNAVVYGSIVQELNEDKVVVWQWRSWDHYKITDASPSGVDFYNSAIAYCHLNSIDVVDANRIIISSRLLGEVTEIDRNTGKIIWRFGGLNNQFNINPDFHFQHDARLVDNNRLSLLDNGNVNNYSRALVFAIDEQNKTAQLVNEVHHIPEANSNSMGNVQYHDNMYTVGWGNTGNNTYYMSGFDATGATVYNDSLKGSHVISYRAFKFPWETKLITSDSDTLKFLSGDSNSQKVLKIKNNGNTALEISGVFNKSTSFQVLNTFPINVNSGAEVNLTVQFTPASSNKIVNTIYIVSQKTEQMVALPVILIGNSDVTSSIEENFVIPKSFRLEQNYPNPFNPTTNIRYGLPTESKVKIKIYNLLGQEIKELVNNTESAGYHEINFNAADLASGIYFYKIVAISTSGNITFSDTKKLLLLK